MSRKDTAGAARCEDELATTARATADAKALGDSAVHSKTISGPTGEGRGRGPAPPLHALPETGEPPLREAALYIPSSPTHEPDYGSQRQPAPLKREDVEEPAGLAAVAEIAALECALAAKERLRAQKSKGAAANGNGGGGGGAGGGEERGPRAKPVGPALQPLLPAKRKSDEVALGQALDVPLSQPPPQQPPPAVSMACGMLGSGAGAAGAPPPPHLAAHMHAAAAAAAGQLPLGPGGAAPVVGVPVQQAEALRAQQLQLQATILAQAQGQVEEVATSVGEVGASTSRHDDDAVDGSGESGAGDLGKKQRLVWTTELHNRFINAITHLGLKHAVPKNILTMMNVEGMTRENVASHLQKYRMYLKKIGGFSDKDKVDPDALQTIHEQNVQQMAAQQALQQSLAAMHGGYGYAYGAVSDSPTSAQAQAQASMAVASGAPAPSQPQPPCAAAGPSMGGPPGGPGGWPNPMFPPAGGAYPGSGGSYPAGAYPYPPYPYPGPPAGAWQQQGNPAQHPPPSGMPQSGQGPGVDPNNYWGWAGAAAAGQGQYPPPWQQQRPGQGQPHPPGYGGGHFDG